MASLSEHVVNTFSPEDIAKLIDNMNAELMLLRQEKEKFETLKEDVSEVLKFEWPEAKDDFGVQAVLALGKHLSP